MTTSDVAAEDSADQPPGRSRYVPEGRYAVRIHARELARRLRDAREAAGLTNVALSRAVGMSETATSRMVNGVFTPTVTDVAAVLAACGVFGQERDRILDLCRPGRDLGVLRLSEGTQWDAFLYHAGRAQRLIEYQPVVIPWLAQTDDYVSAYWSPHLKASWQPWNGKFDQGAQTLLRARVEWIELIVHEWALRAPIAPHAARSTQMHFLRKMSSTRKTSLHVIPVSCAPPATAASGFTILEFEKRPDLIYREEPTAGTFCDDPDLVEEHRAILRQLQELALSVPASRELLQQIQNGPAPDDHPIDPVPTN